MRYRISKEALRDLEKIWFYSAENWSAEQADRYYNLLMDEIEFIAANPKSGVDFSDHFAGYWRTRVKSHFIFYKVSDKQNLIEIIRILHQQMDIDDRLGE